MRLTMFTRRGCHLCDDMLFDLMPFERNHGVQIDVVDVDTDAALLRQYGDRVPVLAAAGQEICHGHLDPAALNDTLAATDRD